MWLCRVERASTRTVVSWFLSIQAASSFGSADTISADWLRVGKRLFPLRACFFLFLSFFFFLCERVAHVPNAGSCLCLCLHTGNFLSPARCFHHSLCTCSFLSVQRPFPPCRPICQRLPTCYRPVLIPARISKASLAENTQQRHVLTRHYSRASHSSGRGKAPVLSRSPSDCRLRLISKHHALGCRPLLQEFHPPQLDRRGWQLQAPSRRGHSHQA